jgi:hypothetical protein
VAQQESIIPSGFPGELEYYSADYTLPIETLTGAEIRYTIHIGYSVVDKGQVGELVEWRRHRLGYRRYDYRYKFVQQLTEDWIAPLFRRVFKEQRYFVGLYTREGNIHAKFHRLTATKHGVKVEDEGIGNNLLEEVQRRAETFHGCIVSMLQLHGWNFSQESVGRAVAMMSRDVREKAVKEAPYLQLTEAAVLLGLQEAEKIRESLKAQRHAVPGLVIETKVLDRDVIISWMVNETGWYRWRLYLFHKTGGVRGIEETENLFFESVERVKTISIPIERGTPTHFRFRIRGQGIRKGFFSDTIYPAESAPLSFVIALPKEPDPLEKAKQDALGPVSA